MLAMLLLLPLSVAAGDNEEQKRLNEVVPNVIRYVVELVNSNNSYFSDLLKKEGLEIRRVGESSEGLAELQQKYQALQKEYAELQGRSEYRNEMKKSYHSLNSKACFALFQNGWEGCETKPISEINRLSKTLSLTSWLDVINAVKSNFFNFHPSADEHFIKAYSTRECRKYYPSLNENVLFFECQFRVGATYIKFRDDNKTCQGDSDVLYADVSEEERVKLKHICIRNLGWQSSVGWEENVTY